MLGPAPQSLVDSITRHERFMQIDPGNETLRLNLGDLYHQAGRFDDALTCFERCLSSTAHAALARSRAASVMISLHRFADAEALLRPLLAAQPDDSALKHNLGLTLYFQHRFDDARALFDGAAEQGLRAPSNFAYLARSQHHLGNMKEAIAAGTEWANASPSVASKSYLALLHIDGGEIKEALRLGEEVLAEDRENVDANIAVGSARMETQETERARECFQIALRRDPENGRAWLGMGLVHLYDQEPSQAIEALANASRLFPDNAGIAVTYGWAFIVAGDAQSAEKAFDNALRVDHTFSECHAGYAAALALKGNLDRAQSSLEIARRLNRRSIGADVAESFLKAARGQQKEAGEVFAQALQKRPRADVLPLIDQLRIYISKNRLPLSKHRQPR